MAAALFPPYTVDMRRPGIVTAMAVLNFVGGGFALLAALGILVVSLAGGRSVEQPAVLMLMGLVYAVFGAGYVAVGVGLLQMKGWARIAQIVIACLGILSCGIIISVLMLVYLFKPGVKVLFSGKTAEELTPQEAADVAQLGGSKGTTIAIVVVVVMMMIAVIGMIAAIAIPSLLRARVSANESAAIGNLRSIVSAEAAYQGANGGYYDVPACLIAPEPCLRTSAPRFLDPETVVFDTPKSGYVLRFHPGETATAPDVSPSSLTAFAVTAVPEGPGTGVRSFCIDASGVIYTMAEGDRSPVGGECPQTGRMLR